MFRDRQQLDVRVSHLQHIGNERRGQLEITEMPISLVRAAPPGPEMHLVNAHRAARPVLPAPRFHPRAVVPLIFVQIANERRGRFAVLIEKREWIALEQNGAGLSPDLELVMRASFESRQKRFPHAAAEKFAHRIDAAVPIVEIANYADPLRVRRTDCKINAALTADRAQMGAELFVNLPVLTSTRCSVT